MKARARAREVICSFNSFLVENYRIQRDKEEGFGNKGLVIIDKYREEQYKQLLDTFLEEGTKYGYLANIVDIPYFARCRDTPMLQLADLCAYAIFRFYGKHDDTYFNLIRPRLYRTIHGRLFGLKHITNDACTCTIIKSVHKYLLWFLDVAECWMLFLQMGKSLFKVARLVST